MRRSPRAALVLSTLLALLVTGVVAGPASTGATGSVTSVATTSARAAHASSWCANATQCRRLGLPAPRSVRVAPRPELAVVQRARALGAEQCDDGSGAWCGTVEVPQDYDDPTGDTLTVSWKLFPHSDPGPAASTVAWIGGGPGYSTISDEGGAFFMLGALLDTHDLLLVDQRGRGSSEPIRCSALQHGHGSLRTAARACANQLGDRIDDYTSADAARDLEAVRADLVIDELDLVGTSYGGEDALAYSARFPDHLRSVVLNAGLGPDIFRLPGSLRHQAAVSRRIAPGLCQSSPTCRREVAHPQRLLAWGADYLRRHPFRGVAEDPGGARRHVRVTENALFGMAALSDLVLTVPGELPAALQALRTGYRAPILRLAAVLDWYLGFQDSGDPTEFSFGATMATDCADARPGPWPDGLTIPERIAAARHKAATISAEAMRPWRIRSLMRTPRAMPNFELAVCLFWPDVPGADPIVPAGAQLPDVPVLAVTGEYDGNVPVEDTLDAASLFPDFQHLSTGETPHTSGFWRCGPRRIRAFLDTLGDVSQPCTDKPERRWFVQPSYPQHGFGAVPLRVGNARADHSTPRLRHLAGAAWQTVLDGWIVTFRRFLTTNHGLHGGTITDTFASNTYAIDFHRYRFTRDLAISGRLEQEFSRRVVVTRVRVDLPGHRHGRLVLRANMSLKRSGLLKVTGTLAGRHVDLVGSTR